MCHPHRDDFPDLSCSKLCLDIDASGVIGLSIYPYKRGHVGMHASFRAACAQATVQNELPAFTADTEATAVSSTRRVGNFLSIGVTAVGSKRMTGT